MEVRTEIGSELFQDWGMGKQKAIGSIFGLLVKTAGTQGECQA